MVADREALQAVFVQDIAARLDVAGVGEGFVYLEVIAPARQLQAVEAPVGGLLGQRLQRQISCSNICIVRQPSSVSSRGRFPPYIVDQSLSLVQSRVEPHASEPPPI